MNQDGGNQSIHCKWTYPEFFPDEKDAMFTIAGMYKKKTDYNCVLDIVNMICYPDKNEAWIFGFAVGGTGLLFLISIGVFFYARYWVQKKKDELNKELSERISS